MERIDWSKAPHWADRVVRGGTLKLDYWANDCKLQPVNNSCPPFKTNSHIREDFPLVERRPEFVPGKPLMSFSWLCNAEPAPITIEQRIASLLELEKQVEETRAELTRDLEALGLTWMVRDEPTITDWRDLRVGDVVEHIKCNGGKVKLGAQGVVSGLKDWGIVVDYTDHRGYRYSCPENLYKFRFIRRP